MRFDRAAVCAAILALSHPGPAAAAVYYIVARTADSWAVVDPATAETLESGVRRLPTISVQKSITAKGPPRPGYVKTISEFDCAKRQSRWVRLTLYDRSGATLLSEQNPKPGWSEPARGTDAGSTLSLLCGEPGGVDLPAVSVDSLGSLILSLFAGWAPR